MYVRNSILPFLLCFLTLNSFAELGPKIRKPANSAMPGADKPMGASGYSAHRGNSGVGTNHSFTKHWGKKNELSGYRHSLRSSTFGIVTSIKGKVFCIHQNGKLILPVKNGDGILKNDIFWIEGGTLLQVASTSGSMLSVAGPAAVGFHQPDQAKVYKGTLRVKTAKNNPYFFSSVFLDSKVLPSSDSAFWVSSNKVQAVTFAGTVQAWHPQLKEEVVNLPPHFFTEHELEKAYLQPRFPELTTDESILVFLDKFKDVDPSIELEKESTRNIASVIKSVFRGSRAKSEIIESASSDYEMRLKAHITGRDWPERESYSMNKKSSSVAPLVARGPASVNSNPGHESSGGRAMNPQTEALIRKFVSSQ